MGGRRRRDTDSEQERSAQDEENADEDEEWETEEEEEQQEPRQDGEGPDTALTKRPRRRDNYTVGGASSSSAGEAPRGRGRRTKSSGGDADAAAAEPAHMPDVKKRRTRKKDVDANAVGSEPKHGAGTQGRRTKKLDGTTNSAASKRGSRKLQPSTAETIQLASGVGSVVKPPGRGRKRRRRGDDVSELDEEVKKVDWKVRPSEKYDGKRLTGVPFTKEENQKLMLAVESILGQNNMSLENMKGTHKIPIRKFWSKVAVAAGIETRMLDGIRKRVYRAIHVGRKWSPAETKALLDTIKVEGPRYNSFAKEHGFFEEKVRQKYKKHLIVGQKSNGRWTHEEYWALRHAVLTHTGKLVPTSNIPWGKVYKHVPSRNLHNCYMKWYYDILPTLMSYKTEHGWPVEKRVLLRHLLRRLRKFNFETEDLVPWSVVSRYWPGHMNKSEWARMQRSLELKYPNPNDRTGLTFDERLEALCDVFGVDEHYASDHNILKNAKVSDEYDTRFFADEEDDEGDVIDWSTV